MKYKFFSKGQVFTFDNASKFSFSIDNQSLHKKLLEKLLEQKESQIIVQCDKQGFAYINLLLENLSKKDDMFQACLVYISYSYYPITQGETECFDLDLQTGTGKVSVCFDSKDLTKGQITILEDFKLTLVVQKNAKRDPIYQIQDA